MSGGEKEIIEQEIVPKKKRRWLKWTLYLVIFLLVLVVVLYGTITSSWGIRELILPRIAAGAGMKIQADEVDASLFKSRIAVTGLKAERQGQFQFSGKKISCNFDLGAIMDGNIKLSNIRVDGVKGNLQITEKSKPVKSDSPSIPPSMPASAPKKPPAVTKSSPVTLDLRDIKISDVDFELKMTGPSGERTFSLNQVNVASERFTNGQDAKIVLTSLADITSGDELRLKGALDIDAVVNLGTDWKLNKLILNKTGIIGVSGKVGDTIITKRSLNLAADITISDTDLKISKFNFSEVNGLNLSGIDLIADIKFKPLKINADIKKGHLSNDLISSVAMIAAGVSPGNNQLDFGGKITTVNDNIKAALKLKITRSGNIVFNKHIYPLMPAIVNADTKLLCNLKQERVKVGSFNVNVVSRGQKRLNLKLLEAYTLRRNAELPGQLNLFMEAQDIDLKFINIFVSGLDLGGSFSAKLYIDLARLYKDIAVRGAWAVKGFSMKVPKWQMPQISVANKLDCSITDFKEFNIAENTLKFYDGEKYQGEATLTGKYNLKSKAGQVKFRTVKLDSSFIRKFIFTPDNPANSYITSLEPLTVDATTDLRLSAHRIVYKDTSLDFKQNDRDFVIAKVPDFKMLLQKPLAEIYNTQCSLKINRLDLTWLNRFLPRDKCSFQQGQGSFDGLATFGSSVTDIKFAIKSAADKIYFKAPNGRFNDLNYKLEIRGRWSLRYGLQQTSFDIALGQEMQRIARLKGDGSCVFPAGPLSFELSCNGLNQGAVNLFKPNALNRLNTDLKLNCLASAGFKKFSYSGHVVLHNLRTKPETAPISGKLDLGGDGGLDFVTGTADLALNSISTKKQLANLNMQYKWPLVNSKKTGFLNVDSSLIDMPGLRNVIAADRKAKKVDQKRSAYKKTKSKKPVEIKFDFGERGIKSQLNLKKILLAGNNKCSVFAKLFLRKKTFTADPLKLVVNNAPLDAKITMVSDPAGVAYKIKADSNGFDLAPFFKLLPVTEAQSSTGKLRDLALDVHGVGLHAPKLWDNMNGNLKIDLEDISIPYSFSNTWVGNVFFIPLNMMTQISKYLPVLAKSPRAMFSVNYFKDIVSSKYNIELEKSRIRLQSDNGEIKVNKCEFSGRKIGNFSFTGTMRLGTGDRLDLNSLYSFYGIDLPVRIYGTLEHPKTDSVARISTEFLRRNTLGILRGEGVGKIIKNSGNDLKQIFNNIRNGVKQEESDDSQNATENKDNSSKRERRKKLEENIKKSVNELIKLF